MSNIKTAVPVTSVALPKNGTPDFYMLPLGTYRNLIARGQNALAQSGADEVIFYNVNSDPEASFLEVATVASLNEEGPVITLTRSDSTKYCKKIEQGRRKTDWRGPHLLVKRTSASLFWQAYDFPAKLTVELFEYSEGNSYLVAEDE